MRLGLLSFFSRLKCSEKYPDYENTVCSEFSSFFQPTLTVTTTKQTSHIQEDDVWEQLARPDVLFK